MKRPIVCIDRDGTLTHDESDHLFLGRDGDWKPKVRILPDVIEGLRLLKTVHGLATCMITKLELFYAWQLMQVKQICNMPIIVR